MTGKSIILFDGICKLCNGFARFIIQRDRHKHFTLGHVQGAYAQALKEKHPWLTEVDSIIYVEGDEIYTHSNAILKIAKKLGFPWSIGVVFGVLPKGIRDYLYRRLAKRRYRIFGQYDQCMMPTAAIKERFID